VFAVAEDLLGCVLNFREDIVTARARPSFGTVVVVAMLRMVARGMG
jgi:hypothetical protein